MGTTSATETPARGFNTRSYRLLTNLINEGEITVGEAKQHLADSLWLSDAERQLLAGWVLDHFDDDAYAGFSSFCHDCGASARTGTLCPACGSDNVR